MPHSCPVCQYPKLKEAPRSKSGGGSYEICPSCGFQFGVDDDDKGLTFTAARTAWLKRGAPWSSSGQKAPKGWDGKTQAAAPAPKAPAKKRVPAKSTPRKKTPPRQ